MFQKQAATVLTEVNAILEELRLFLLGLDIPDQSWTCLLQVDSVLAFSQAVLKPSRSWRSFMD